MQRGAILLVLTCCGTAAAQTPAAAELAFFESRVRPLLVEHCFACHSAEARKPKGGLLLDSRDAILKGGDSGPAVVPGKPEESLLIQVVRYTRDDAQMPPSGKLPAAAIAVLEQWVQRGAIYPGPATAVLPVGGIDWSKAREFWSFQPPRAMASPLVHDTSWLQRRCDAFILAELEKRGLTPSPAADRRILIRRATFDLIGLPPTAEEVQTFINDERPDAYARLIDRLLASPQYGERWARMWLDLARYCDIAEPWSEVKGAPWLYRDWVVQAFNDDLPYDQFVHMQLAADLLPNAAAADRAALGFLGLSPVYWKELMLDKEVIKGVVAEEWEERIHTLTSTFLGLTAACARCHDHKYDPISMQDYYGLAGVFASSRPAEVSLLPDADAARIKEALAKIRPLEEKVKKLQTAKTDSKTDPALAVLTSQITAIKQATPGIENPLACGVIEASLYVHADGPNKTRLEYKPGEPQNVALQIRGNPSKPGPVVPRRFLTVLSADPPRPFTQGSGRLELARAITSEGAPLAARVIVNRIWKQHFGAGIVDTPSDFGSQGGRPTHPQLLDDLTAGFIVNAWSLKWLHREIMLSAAYQQSSVHDQRKHTVDPDNRWLWRMNRRRLDVEAWRDAMLAVSGTLSRERGGPAFDLSDGKNPRRTLYGTVKRRELHSMLRLFDFPEPVTHSAARTPTTTPLQQLFTLNSSLLQQQAAALVNRLQSEALANDEERIQRAYQLLYGRPATENQVRLGKGFLGSSPTAESWVQYGHVLLGSNEFAFVD